MIIILVQSIKWSSSILQLVVVRLFFAFASVSWGGGPCRHWSVPKSAVTWEEGSCGGYWTVPKCAAITYWGGGPCGHWSVPKSPVTWSSCGGYWTVPKCVATGLNFLCMAAFFKGLKFLLHFHVCCH